MAKRKSSYSKGKKKTKDARKEAKQNSIPTKSPRKEGSFSNPKSLSLEPAPKPDRSPVVEDDNGGLALAADLLLTLPRNIWWHILQDNDGDLDISTGSRQEWSLILPVFLKSRLFHPPKLLGSSKLQINKERWDHLKLFMKEHNGVVLEYTKRQKNKQEFNSYHVMVRRKDLKKPKYNSIQKQSHAIVNDGWAAIGLNALSGTRRSTRQNEVDDREIKSRLEEFRSQFLNDFLSLASENASKNKSMIKMVEQYLQELVAASELLEKQHDIANDKTGTDENEKERRPGGSSSKCY
mmetsp:Transcript_42053/g.75824  ORF Transcript_42053/g.75824 Transcript_42053/m.75824 type:complete len:294 (-) Transcript_42053:317-1198(-)